MLLLRCINICLGQHLADDSYLSDQQIVESVAVYAPVHLSKFRADTIVNLTNVICQAKSRYVINSLICFKMGLFKTENII